MFNHYNRVQANLSSLADDQYGEWKQEVHDRASSTTRWRTLFNCGYRLVDAESDVSPAQLQPHPRRLPPPPPLPFSNPKFPLFEKSNVLVM